ncbi:MAG TPA: NADH-quinone oxidoreductase subunit L [Nitrospirota bacterium]|nr:NADH-quinone oxidoreductase subunit L [Nitrospirota bacterium]
MNGSLFLIPALPFAGFLILATMGRRLTKRMVAVVGVGSVGLAALLAVFIAVGFVTAPPQGNAFTQTLWTWMQFDGYSVPIAFALDPLSLIMVLVVTLVGFLIHLYSAEFMQSDAGYSRFFAYMNLFVGAMLTLVLADNLALLYLGWEGVGLCSYLLIGFWYADPANGRAARKAFIVTRVGDTAMAIGLFLLFTNLGTLKIQGLMQAAHSKWPVGHNTAVLAAALLLGGALGKSAQLPLQVWLPDAMAGPTPVSALIHAATMVTVGVYLIARTHVLFELAPVVQTAVAIIGAATLLVAGFSALAQRDIKRVLAYSTISQIGYMFLALGVGAWPAAMFHFMTHAFFKALLFLGAGVVILAQHEEHDMFKMGGLRDKLPSTFWTFLIGSASLSALPLVTAGFYSKDLILWQTWSSPSGGAALWAAGLLGAFVTSIYTFRMVFVTFFGEPKKEVGYRPGARMTFPLVILAFFSIAGGFVELPETLGNLPLFSGFLQSVFPETATNPFGAKTELIFQLIASFVSLSGILVAYVFYIRRPRYAEKLVNARSIDSFRKFCLAGWDFDALYDRIIVRPFLWIAEINKQDIIDHGYTGVANFNRALSRWLSKTQTGNIRWYAMGIALGAVVFFAIVIFFS